VKICLKLPMTRLRPPKIPNRVPGTKLKTYCKNETKRFWKNKNSKIWELTLSLPKKTRKL